MVPLNGIVSDYSIDAEDIEVTASHLCSLLLSVLALPAPYPFPHHQSGSYNLDNGHGFWWGWRALRWCGERAGEDWGEMCRRMPSWLLVPGVWLFSAWVWNVCAPCTDKSANSWLHTQRQLAEEGRLISHSKTDVKKKTGRYQRKFK